MASKIRLLSKGTVRMKYSLPLEVVADNILRRTKPDKRYLLKKLTIAELGEEVNTFFKVYLNSEIHAKPAIRTRYYKDLQELILSQLEKIKTGAL